MKFFDQNRSKLDDMQFLLEGLRKTKYQIFSNIQELKILLRNAIVYKLKNKKI
jgi:hypothetical protein